MDLPLADHCDVLVSYVYDGRDGDVRKAIDKALTPPAPPRTVHGLPTPEGWPTDEQIAAEGAATARALGAAV
jgi:hypothetical protein